MKLASYHLAQVSELPLLIIPHAHIYISIHWKEEYQMLSRMARVFWLAAFFSVTSVQVRRKTLELQERRPTS